jgi:hypothetical protein
MKGTKQITGIITNNREFLLEKNGDSYSLPSTVTDSYEYGEALGKAIHHTTGISTKVQKFIGNWDSENPDYICEKVYLTSPMSGIEVDNFNQTENDNFIWMSFDSFEEEEAIAIDLHLFDILQKAKEKCDLQFPK